MPTAQAPLPGARAAPAALRSPPGLWLGGSARGRHRAGTDPLCARACLPGSPGTRAQTPLRPYFAAARSNNPSVYPAVSPLPRPPPRAHTHKPRQELEKGPGLHQGLVETLTTCLHCWAVTILLKEPGRRGPALSQNLYTKQRAQ